MYQLRGSRNIDLQWYFGRGKNHLIDQIKTLYGEVLQEVPLPEKK